MTELTNFNLNKMLRSPKKSFKYILFIFYLLILSLNSSLILTGSDWIIINILAIISISVGLWYAT